MFKILSYTDKGFGTPLVMLHGLGSVKEYWEPQIELSDTYRLIIPDLIGHGNNEANDDITLGNMALGVIELLKELGITNAYIAGISLGGIVAMEIYRRSPTLVRGLIIANSCFYIPYWIGTYSVNKLYNLFHQDKNKLIEYITDRGIYNKEYIEDARKSFYIRDCYIEASKSAIGCNYYSTLVRVNKPTLLIGALYDQVTPVFNTYMMKYLIPHAEIEILNAGHLSSFEKRYEFNMRVRKFIG